MIIMEAWIELDGNFYLLILFGIRQKKSFVKE